ncbi:hypothetical protein [Caryophanon latum]|uniref:Uncharacterized protein n=1 Tax=Caryophanon latum TaxID=33977 RepID=A0A1C0YJF6_9BACL|nr:hypothetical protein [Caryophanon latum]OCS87300.1 hypothetical protein A6K76_02720 [Caryophanon latum]
MKYFSGEKYPLTVKDALQRLYDKGFILEFDHVEDNVYVAHAYTINCDDEICLTATWEWFHINMYDGEITRTAQNWFDEPHEEKYNLTKAQARQILYNEGYITKYAKIVEEEFDSYNYIFTVEDTFDRTTMYIVNPFTSFVDRY